MTPVVMSVAYLVAMSPKDCLFDILWLFFKSSVIRLFYLYFANAINRRRIINRYVDEFMPKKINNTCLF